MLSLYYYELTGKIEKCEMKKCLMIDNYMLDGALGKIKMIIDNEKFDNAKILIETDDKLAGEVALKNVVILILFIIKDRDKFYSYLFLEEALVA